MLNTSSRLVETPYVGETLCLRYFGSPIELKVTPEHRVLTIDPEDPHNESKHIFKEAKDLTSKDWGFKSFDYILNKPDLTQDALEAFWPKIPVKEFPKSTLTGVECKLSKEDLKKYLSEGLTYQEIAQKVGLKTKGAVYQYTLLHGIRSSNNQYFIRNPLSTRAFWRVAGLWVAEGCLSSGGKNRSRNRVDWAFNEDEQELHCIVQRFLDDNGIPSVLTKQKGTKGVRIRASSFELAEFFRVNFGELAADKTLPSWFFHIPRGLQLEFLFGYFQGDGCNKEKQNWATIGSASLVLLNQIQLLLASRFEHPSGIAKLSKNVWEIKFAPIWPEDWGYKAKPFLGEHSKYIRVSKDKLFHKINYISSEEHNGFVYDLTTTPARFTAGGVLVHNCFDPAGWLLERAKADPTLDQWEVITIPALLTKEASKLLGYPEGTSYWPEFYSTESLIKKQKGMPRAHWLATYQQSPIELDGNIIKTEFFQPWSDTNAQVTHVIASLDTAFSTSNQADFSVIQLWGIFPQTRVDSAGKTHQVGCAVLLSQKRGRWEYPELVSYCEEVLEDYAPDVWVIEKKASGQSLIQDLRRRGFLVYDYLPDKDKVSRAYSITPFVEDKRVFIPDRVWAQDFIDECKAFDGKPNKKDDQVDAMCQALLWLRDSHYLNYEGQKTLEELEDERQSRLSNKKYYW